MTYNNAFIDHESKYPGAGEMPSGAKCMLQQNTMADVVFRLQWFRSNEHQVRYCYPRLIVSMLNSEAE